MLVCTGSDTCNANLISGRVEAYRHVNWICRLACSYRAELTGYSLHTSGFGNSYLERWVAGSMPVCTGCDCWDMGLIIGMVGLMGMVMNVT